MSKFNAFRSTGAELARIAGTPRSKNQAAAQDEITRRADKRAAKSTPEATPEVTTPEADQVEILLATLKAQADDAAQAYAQAWKLTHPGEKGFMRVRIAAKTRFLATGTTAV